MVDPITAADVEAPLDDGLPETLAEVVAANGHRYFKLKVGGDVAADIARLSRIAAVLDAIAAPYHVSLDGNEQYADAPAVLELLRGDRGRRRRCAGCGRRSLYIEQPHPPRDALARPVRALDAFAPGAARRERRRRSTRSRAARRSGIAASAARRARAFYKSLINRMRCAAWGDERYFMSGEDLTTLAGLAVQQDLALVGAARPAACRAQRPSFRRRLHRAAGGGGGGVPGRASGSLSPATTGAVRLRITGGQVAIGSLGCPGFGSAVHPDFSAMEPALDVGAADAILVAK